MPNELKCLKCAADMKQGYVLEYGDANLRTETMWIAGPPERSFFRGIIVTDREQYPIESFRCVRCGYLESYALPPPSSR
jgi:predicted nucleic-acid-binding Zn-ribbon protein